VSGWTAEKIGHGTDAFAVQVKKQELPMHDPRLSKALGLGYMVNPHGADHMDSLIDIFYCEMTEQPDVVVADALPLGFERYPTRTSGRERWRCLKSCKPKGLSPTPWYFVTSFPTLTLSMQNSQRRLRAGTPASWSNTGRLNVSSLIEVQGGSVQECIADSIRRYPRLEGMILDGEDRILLKWMVYINNKSAVSSNELSFHVKDGDIITLLPMVAGG
jgi:molybdopterin converting factor small subunit